MEEMLVYPAGSTKACQYASVFLAKEGIPVVDHPTPEVTHLLLDTPSFGANSELRGGGDVKELLRMLPGGIAIIGGNLSHPALEGYKTMDLLKNEGYLACNAAITAECAMQVAAQQMDSAFADSSVLVIGWGRIGKCLASLLRSTGASVTVAARKEADRSMLEALGYRTVDTRKIPLSKYSVVWNTAPELVIGKEQRARCKNGLFIDLASRTGIEGEDVIRARGLPGIYAPKSSGKLIARTFLKEAAK